MPEINSFTPEEEQPRPKFQELVTKYMGGDMHIHSVESNLSEPAERHEADYTFQEIFEYVKNLIDKGTNKAEFIVIADHASDAGKPERPSTLKSQELLEHLNAIHQFNQEKQAEGIEGPKIIAALETNIISSDGGVDVPDELLSQFDLIIASRHSLADAFPESNGEASPEQLTKMYLGLMKNSHVDVIGHINRNLSFAKLKEMDLQEIFKVAKETRTALEINASSSMPDWLIKDAVSSGVPLTIGTDAHDLIKYRNLPEEHDTQLMAPSPSEIQEVEDLPEEEKTAIRQQRLQNPLGFKFWIKLKRPLRALYEADCSSSQIISSSRTNLENWLSKDKKDREISWENAQT